MKAAVFKAAGSPLVVETVPDPTPEPSDLVLKVGACGICGTDLHMSENTDATVGWRVLPPECVMGHEFAGEVVEVGREVKGDWRIGDRVTALPWIGCGECALCRSGRGFRCASAKMRASHKLPGAYAEYCRVGAFESFRLPSTVSFQEGAMVEPLAVGLNAVRRAGLRPGDSVLIVGAGPVGLSVALWCRFFGAQHIVVSDLVEVRAERALSMGATSAVDARHDDVMEHVEAVIGARPEIVFDAVGVPGSLQLAIDYAAHDGRLVVVGLCMAGDHLFPTKALVKELDIRFAFIYPQADFATVLELLGLGRVDAKPMISDRIGLSEFSNAFEALKQPNQQIKVMLEPN